MSIKSTDTKSGFVREYDRLMLRSSFVSLFWAVIKERKRHGKFTLRSIADAIGRDKSTVSRWFSNDQPNWELDTISDLAWALDLNLEVTARARDTGTIFASTGPIAGSSDRSPLQAPAPSTINSPVPKYVVTENRSKSKVSPIEVLTRAA
jgi:hypothetical protein